MTNTILIFDWGDTIMRDFDVPGKMKDWEHVEYIEGAEEMLQEISGHFLCCVATSADKSDTNDMIAALRRVDADKYFSHFFSSAELGVAKPNPEFFATILRKLDFRNAIYFSIGNLYEKDIVPAKQAGLKSIWFNEYKIKGDFPDADYIINSWSELPGILLNQK